MAWREIMARVMDDFQVLPDVSPDWLVNPATNRRLKLDLLYPEVGLAVRFVGLTAKGQPKQSDWELQEEEQRDQTRAELCRQNGVELFLLETDHPQPPEQLQKLRTTLTRLSRTLAQSNRPERDKAGLMPKLAAARSRLDEVSRRVKRPDDLALFAELWRDRESAGVAATRQPLAPAATPGAQPLRLHPDLPVRHERFGPGTVVALAETSGDTQITIRFDTGEERTFLASLVGGKLTVTRNL
jgi:hypothetical protein